MNQFSRGETTGGVISGKAIGYLQEAGGKIVGMRTQTLNEGFRKIVEQVLWLIHQFYSIDRMVSIYGEDVGFQNFFNTKDLPYMVQVEVEKRNPAQIQAQNEMFLQAYTMAAQAQQFFPLSTLFRMLNVEGKDRLIPIIEQNENTQQMIQSLQSQNEEMAMQMEQMAKENENLKRVTASYADSLSSIGMSDLDMSRERDLSQMPEMA